MLKTGRMNKRITFCKNGFIENEVGEEIPAFEEIRTVWANVEPLKGKEYLENEKVRAKQSYRFKTRYYKNIALNTDMIIKYNNREFEINGIIDYYEKHAELHFMCTEVVK